MMEITLAAFVVLVFGSVAAVGWGWRQRAALRAFQRQAEQGRDAEQLLAREAQAALLADHERLQTQLGETQRELASLSYSISHDLRAPLRGVDGFSQALAEDYGHCLNPTAHDYLRRVRANAQLMSSLIDQLLALSRIVRAQRNVETLDLSALAHETAAELAASDPARRVEWDIQPGMVVRGDRSLLGTAVGHLLGNAWKFTARRPVAHIAFQILPPVPGAEESGTVYQVRDDGVGFEMQYAGKLFNAFQRMHPPEEFPGHGIGLAAVQRICRQHGGSVWADSAPDQGAVFSFTLDAVPVPAAVEASRLRPALRAADAAPPLSRLPKTTPV